MLRNVQRTPRNLLDRLSTCRLGSRQRTENRSSRRKYYYLNPGMRIRRGLNRFVSSLFAETRTLEFIVRVCSIESCKETKCVLLGSRQVHKCAVGRNSGDFRNFVACSNAYASLISVGSLQALPKKEMPTGRPKKYPAGTVTLG
jgi:hypothetical protein